MPRTAAAQSGVVTFQGIEVPAESVNPDAFFALTRRHRNPEKAATFAGLGNTDTVELKKSDIIAGIRVRFVGSAVVALNGGTAATTMRWPYDLPRFRFTANGQSNMINCSGAKLKAREMMVNVGLDDRGIPQLVGGSTVSTGTLSKTSEAWGLGAGANLAPGTFPIELEWVLPIAEEEVHLAGAIFAQTSTMDLNLNIDWQSASSLFVLTGGATVTLSGTYVVETEKFSIPVLGGNMVIPDLSVFHSFIEGRQANSLATGANEVRLVGQGSGKTLLRCLYQHWNGSPVQSPIAVNATNLGTQAYRFGSNETPETFQDAMSLRHLNEWEYGTDIAAQFGFLCHDFAQSNAFRDVIDMGQTSELRIVTTINSGVALASPVVEYVQETIYSAGE